MHKVLLLPFLAVSCFFSSLAQTSSPTLTTQYYWDVNNASWEKDVRHLTEPSTDPLTTVEMTEKWDADAAKWKPYLRHVKVFDGSGNLLQSDLYRWDGSQYYAYFQQKMTYNDEGFLERQIDSRRDRSIGQLQPFSQLIVKGNFYDRIKIFQHYVPELQKWGKSKVFQERYDQEGRKINSLKWHPGSRETYSYSSDGDLETVTREIRKGTNEWEFAGRNYFHKGENNKISLKTSTRPIISGKQVGQAISTTERFFYNENDLLTQQIEQTRNPEERTIDSRIVKYIYDQRDRKTQEITMISKNGLDRPTIRIVYSYDLHRHAADMATEWSVSISPNPLTETARIQLLDAPTEAFTFTLYDMSGRMLRQQSIGTGEEAVIQREGLASGVYTYLIQQADNTQVQKVGKLMIK